MRRLLINLGLMAGSLVFIAFSGELSARWYLKAHSALPPRFEPWLSIYKRSLNEDLVYELRPGAYIKIGALEFRINSGGFRDHEYTRQKPEGVFRVAVLGDSITHGWDVNLEETYVKHLERLLNQSRAAGKKYEVLNFGVTGYDLLEEVALLKTKASKYQPDLVIFGYCLNDLMQTHGMLPHLYSRQEGEILPSANYYVQLFFGNSEFLKFLLRRLDRFLVYKTAVPRGLDFYLSKAAFDLSRKINRDAEVNAVKRAIDFDGLAASTAAEAGKINADKNISPGTRPLLLSYGERHCLDILVYGMKELKRIQEQKRFKAVFLIFPLFDEKTRRPQETPPFVLETLRRVSDYFDFKILDLLDFYRHHKDFEAVGGSDMAHPNRRTLEMTAEAIHARIFQRT